ncbi:sugar ABC transporter permease [Actinoplanes sp. NBRC 14428]|uniref:Autoinducer 2 import system permease protein LsrD n=1 Tax=Pseudosporangium ferrugineum TaxID=439699 RepID=A0A2T0RE48_9ACTN|nr:ABC transporter permease [Pseudosporangium ferrugineum]PRY19433.1 monosaccharide ABC transporter membrane protein (CUT2 family) [Pseudosporangium ferrugineum]BCJ52571.1 sugar ABC transporter permease [Actinoplanes sp. NBRC 14428]
MFELRKRLASWDSIIILLTAAVLVVASLAVPNFGTSRNFTFLILDLMPIVLVALTMTFIIVTGEIDLSVASTLGLTSSLMGWFWNNGLSIETIVPLCIVVGAVLGAFNGFLVTGLGLPSLAVTIGTLALYRGLAFVVLGDGAVADFPYNYTAWVTGTIGGGAVPNVLIVIVALAVVFGVVLHATPFGRSLYAIGANAQAAHFSGIRVARTKFWLYVASGAIAGLVGVLWTLRYSSARADNGSGLELAVVAAVLLGGVSIFGGKGTLPGVLAGVVLLAALQNALRLQDVSGQALNIVTGALLVLSVLLPNLASSIRTTWQRRRLRQAAVH